MPTDLPPDYKPRPASDPANPPHPNDPGAVAPPRGEDVRDPSGRPSSGPRSPEGAGPSGDVVDPPGWGEPSLGPDSNPLGVPSPAGTPTF